MGDYESFKEKVYRKSGIDLNSYKERQMKRRVESMVTRNNHKSFESYFEELSKNKEKYEEFINYLTINVSEFYRNPQQWDDLEKNILPSILKNKRNIKVWSSAGSTGEEPYSLVMLLSKFIPISQITVLATDIDDGAIARAKNGIYNKKSLDNLPKEFIDKHFTQHEDRFNINKEIKDRVKYTKLNLLSDEYPKECDLILCRNVMIYFTEEVKIEMYNKFRESLSKDGVLFVGSTEQIMVPSNYKLKSLKTFFYGKE